MSSKRDVLDRKCKKCGQSFQTNAAQIKKHAKTCKETK